MKCREYGKCLWWLSSHTFTKAKFILSSMPPSWSKQIQNTMICFIITPTSYTTFVYGSQVEETSKNKILITYNIFFYDTSSKSVIKKKVLSKNPAYGRHQLCRPMRIVGPIQIWRGNMIYLFFYAPFFLFFFKVTKVTTKSYWGYYWTPKMAIK